MAGTYKMELEVSPIQACLREEIWFIQFRGKHSWCGGSMHGMKIKMEWHCQVMSAPRGGWEQKRCEFWESWPVLKYLQVLKSVITNIAGLTLDYFETTPHNGGDGGRSSGRIFTFVPDERIRAWGSTLWILIAQASLSQGWLEPPSLTTSGSWILAPCTGDWTAKHQSCNSGMPIIDGCSLELCVYCIFSGVIWHSVT